MKIEVSEKRIVKAMNSYFKNFKKYPRDMEETLLLGQAYKNADLTPFYVYDQISNKFIVTSKENVDKKGN